MAISGVTDYTNTYAANYAGATKGGKDTAPAQQTTEEYISGLEKKYGIKISLVDFINEKQSDAYVFGSQGGNNLALASNIAEKMAKDSAFAAKYEQVIADVPKSTEEMKSRIADLGGENLACGVSIDKNGKVSYWSVSRYNRDTRQGTDYKKILQEQSEEKRAKKKEEEALKEKRLEKAETLEKLLEKIRTGAGASVKIQEEGKGAQLDLTI